MEISINTSRCYVCAKQWNDNSHISSLKWQFLMQIVILLIISCQKTSKSISHVSQAIVAIV